MLALLLLFLTSFAASLLITPACRALALRLGWVDQPDQKRKIHAVPVARVGGVAVLAAYVVAVGLFALIPLHTDEAVQQTFRLVWRLLPSVSIVFLTGFLDDRFDLRPWQKLAGQMVAATLACFSGVQIIGIGEEHIPSWAGVPLTILWLLACANAFNLIDGLDGLASGIGLFATLTTIVASLLRGDLALARATAPLAGALAGFLRFNLNPATVFLGDAGSLTVGFLLGCYSVIWSHKSATILGMTAPLMALAVPLCDTMLAIVRRFLRSKPIFGADRAHIHHQMLDLGLTPRRVVLSLYAATAMAACFALLQSYVSHELNGVVFLVFCAIGCLCVQRLGYAEFRAVADLLRLRLVRGLLTQRLQLRSLEQSLASAVTPDDCWHAVRDAAREFGFTSVSLRLGENVFRESLRNGADGQWSVRIPLVGSDYLQLTREIEQSKASASSEVPVSVGPFVGSVYRVLSRTSIRAVTGGK